MYDGASISRPEATTTHTGGQRAHRSLVEHTARLERRFSEVRPGVWCYVGNGLSNQTFVEGPDGVIAIDTGECKEEMAAAIAQLRRHTSTPIVAAMYTHFHYVAGTSAILDDTPGLAEIWGHARIEENLRRVGAEVGPAARRGLIEQFGIGLPADGPDGLVNVGLGQAFRQPDHAPFTPGFLPPTRTITEPAVVELAGLEVHLHPTPSDADDNVTIWFPTLGVCVNNILWPALFNVFPIRGEEYRDPRGLIAGIEHIVALEPEHLVGAHGPPLSGRAQNAELAERYRDSIQFLWDQTVRAVNRGDTSAEIGMSIRLPEELGEHYLTQQHYGLAEHHARQIHIGLRGWFDGDPANLFPVPPTERADRLVAGFGGVDAVRDEAQASLDAGDLRWALEVTGWLRRRTDADDTDRTLAAAALRAVAVRTSAANIRNWALTHALELEGAGILARHYGHTLGRGAVLALGARAAVETLRVMIDPEFATGVNAHVAFDIDATTVGLHLRRSVAVTTDGNGAVARVSMDLATLADVLSGRVTLSDAEAAGSVSISGSRDAVASLCRAVEADGLTL
ncbi:MAG: alkyl sulfatase dimerization domain-containing protein [Actinomycetota bacterium]